MAPKAVPTIDACVERSPFFLVLAGLGVRVLRPGGRRATEKLLDRLAIGRDDAVVEFGPGTGWTAARITACRPASYIGVESNARFVPAIKAATAAAEGRCVIAPAQRSGLPDACCDVVVGEAMLGMQSDVGRQAVLAEVHRLLRPGGRYAIHELALSDAAEGVRRPVVEQEVSRALRVSVRPPTLSGWRTLLEAAGLEVDSAVTFLWRPVSARALVHNEGLLPALRVVTRAARRRSPLRRLLELRGVARRHRSALVVVVVIARRPG